MLAVTATLIAQSTVFTYQGRVTVNGTDFTGAGQFKFALVTSSNANHTATAMANAPSGGFITGYNVVSGGNGYVSVPAVIVFGGGAFNGASGNLATVGGGYTNTASGNNATVCGGAPIGRGRLVRGAGGLPRCTRHGRQAIYSGNDPVCRQPGPLASSMSESRTQRSTPSWSVTNPVASANRVRPAVLWMASLRPMRSR